MSARFVAVKRMKLHQLDMHKKGNAPPKPQAATFNPAGAHGMGSVLVSGRPRSSKEKSGASSTCPSNAAYVRQDSQADGSQASLEEQIFEVSIQSMPSARGRCVLQRPDIAASWELGSPLLTSSACVWFNF
eukprot:1159798-Pelagomonas_calceolata.AAC.7